VLLRSLAGLCAAALSLTAVESQAQIRGSELGVVAQVIDGTRITLEYSRPAARGRQLFGKTVAYGQPWTGANWATTLETDKPIRLNGMDVPAGKYSVWLVPRPGAWTVLLDPNHKLFHFQKPDSTAEQIHISAKPVEQPHAELLTWTFPSVAGDAATLRFQWGTTALPLDVVVQPTKPVTLAADVRATYIGSYDLKPMQGIGWPETGRLDIFEHDGRLRGRMPFPFHPGDELEFDLIPAGQDRLSAGLYRDGKLFNIEQGGVFEFDIADERATAVRLRGVEGTVFIEGKRIDG
jgi:hypothetical protein